MALIVAALICGAITASAKIFKQITSDRKSFKDIDWIDVAIGFGEGFISTIIPGSNWFALACQSLASSVVKNGMEALFKGEEFTLNEIMLDALINFLIGGSSKLVAKGVSKLTTKITKKIFIKAPNYSQYQHYFRSKGLNYSRNEAVKQIYRQYELKNYTNEIVGYTVDRILDFVQGLL